MVGKRRGGRYNRNSRPQPFPANKTVTLKYVVGYYLAPGVGNAIPYAVFRANSIYDPEYAVGGHRPLGTDQWNVWYQQYVVTGAKITVKPVLAIAAEQPVAQSPPGVYGIILSRDPNPPSVSTILDNMEQGLGVWRYTTTSGVSAGKSLSLGYSARKFWNISNVNDNRVSIGAGFGADPTYQAYWTLYFGGIDPLIYPSPVSFVVTIQYRCSLAVPQILPFSP